MFGFFTKRPNITIDMSKTERTWEHFGKTNPYFAVSTFDKFKNEHLDESALREFFDSGEAFIERVWKEIETNFETDFLPQKALDFGCGVGRLTLAMAKRCGQVTGIDISEKMLELARNNVDRMNLENVNFVKSEVDCAKDIGEFDFIQSFIVLQHIKPKIGEAIFFKIVKMLAQNGIGVVHFTYSNLKSSLAQKIRVKLYRDFPLTYKLRNFILKKENNPFMPIYLYDVNRLLNILQENGCHKCLIRFSQHGAEGAILFFQKHEEILY